MEQSEDLENKAKRGLEDFNKRGDPDEVEFDIHNRIDRLLMSEKTIASPKKKSVMPLLISAAIIIAIILAIVLYFTRDIKDTSEQTDQILASYFEPFPNIMDTGVRGLVNEDSALDSLIVLGMEHYENKEFTSAILYLDKENVPIEINLYVGVSYLANGNAEAAISHFETMLAEKNHNLQDASSWYLALSYLKANDTEKALSHFREISNQERHYKKREATAILAEFE